MTLAAQKVQSNNCTTVTPPQRTTREKFTSVVTATPHSPETLQKYSSGKLSPGHSFFVMLSKDATNITSSLGSLLNLFLWTKKAVSGDSNESFLTSCKFLLSSTVFFGAMPLLKTFFKPKPEPKPDSEPTNITSATEPQKITTLETPIKAEIVLQKKVMENIIPKIVDLINNIPDQFIPDFFNQGNFPEMYNQALVAFTLQFLQLTLKEDALNKNYIDTSHCLVRGRPSKSVCYEENGMVYGLRLTPYYWTNTNILTNLSYDFKLETIVKKAEEDDSAFNPFWTEIHTSISQLAEEGYLSSLNTRVHTNAVPIPA